MKLRWPIRCTLWACCFAALFGQPNLVAAKTESENFRAILELAEIGPDVLTQLGEGPEYSDDDWQLLLQVFNRLQQFGDPHPAAPYAAQFSLASTTEKVDRLGEIVRLRGMIVSAEKLSLPARFSDLQEGNVVYRCQLRFPASEGKKSRDATILTTRIPRSWDTKEKFQEEVRVRGTLVQFSAENSQPLILTGHLAWYPIAGVSTGVSTGQLLLARYGMDVALLDEVRHRQPFVKPEISREGEAFYAVLAALDQVNPQELVQQAQKNVADVAERWQAQQAELRSEHQKLEAEFAATIDNAVRESLQKKIKQAKKKRGLSAAVVKQAEAGRSSVAPMFLQPEKEVGELCFFEGTARRAVRIATEQPHGNTEQPHGNAGQPHGNPEQLHGNTGDRQDTNLAEKSYYELEVFTSDSQNRPIVCCMSQLPDDFPTGDEIREPVRISGIFFKLWRYRSRELAKQAGETTGQRQLYTPVVLGHSPTWLNKTTQQNSRWALWGGLLFLGGLMVLWIYSAMLARRDRRARTLLRRSETIDFYCTSQNRLEVPAFSAAGTLPHGSGIGP